jgi:hypothetical protein
MLLYGIGFNDLVLDARFIAKEKEFSFYNRWNNNSD